MNKIDAVRVAVASLLASAALSSAAAPVTYIGYDAADQGASGTIPIGSAFSTQRVIFEGLLVDIAKESFGSAASAAASNLATPGLGATASITQSDLLIPNVSDPSEPPINAGLRGSVKNEPRPGGSFPGRFNTTGSGLNNQQPAGAWWETDGGFSLNLGGLFQAFAFDATDFSDFDGALKMSLFREGNLIALDTPQQAQLLTLTRPGNTFVGNGSVLFFGFASEFEFDRIDFFVEQASPGSLNTYDVIGFDQLTIGRLANTTPPGQVPVPGTLALTAIAFLALGAARRRAVAA